MVVQTTGLVGISTSTPAQQLSVGGSLFVGATSNGGTNGGLGVGEATTTAGVIQTASTSGLTLIQSDVHITGNSNGTSTLELNPGNRGSGYGRHGCIQFVSNEGTFYLFATTTGPAIFISGTCE